MIIIEPAGDLTVGVVEYDDSVHVAHDQEKVVLHEDKFLVKRSVLVSSSDALAVLIARDAPMDAKPAFFQMKDLSTTSMEIWFRSFHATMTPSLHQVKIEEMWNLAVFVFLMNPEKCSSFGRWPVTCTISTSNCSTLGSNGGTQIMKSPSLGFVNCCIHAGSTTTRRASWKRQRKPCIIP